uniref:Potassium channel protein n=1 Tax=uncultured Thiotrichaceae bacterium TaxID=298394 RepID=A0A6S6UJI0_9GAMM|nr:MAG: Potassium channel protein [uncultured Thiotrichaceae bacterium]
MPGLFYILLRRLRIPLIVLVIIYAISILGFVLIPGQDDLGNVWQMSFFHAFYFVSYMASTIGFGEIPYAFTDAQRMWAMFTIYASVIGWLYSIGALLGILQDPAFRRLRSEYLFRRKVENIHSPFYLICGYGDTGAILVEALSVEGIKSVVVDPDENNINELELNDYQRHPLGIVGDASHPKVLESAGVTSPYCLGVIALTDSDPVNLLIALTTHLLNPGTRFLARADSDEAVANICSFGNNIVINPFDSFAERLVLSLKSPGHYTLLEWMTGVPNEPFPEPSFPKKGHWVICGYGRFGQTLHEQLSSVGAEASIIEPNLLHEDLPGLIKGHGTGADSLCLAGVSDATGIIAGTDNDGNNLSILMTARELNPDIFMVARQNNRENSLIFDRAGFHLTMKRGDVVAHKIFALLRTPLLSDFLSLASDKSEAWVNQLLSRILGVMNENVPYLWEVKISKSRTPALYHACKPSTEKNGSSIPVLLRTLQRDPRNRDECLQVIPLLLKREGAVLLLPDVDVELQVSDRILMCAARDVRRRMDWAAHNDKVLHYLLTGEDSQGKSYFLRWLMSFSKQNKSVSLD